MRKINTGFIKACNFYVSEWHLYAAMLPFVRDELKYENKVIIISQDNLMTGLNKLIDKIDIKFYNSNGINDIRWIRDIEELDINSGINPTNIFIQGTIDYINEMEFCLKEKFKNVYREVRIINCYELYDSNNSLYEILDKHDYVFNTGGLKRKELVFPDYAESRLTRSH
ncbi:MAG: hypothetical protein J6C46_12790 [Clostridia bacterium]|nr:hypothetical protein [Clostridia bacterium]